MTDAARQVVDRLKREALAVDFDDETADRLRGQRVGVDVGPALMAFAFELPAADDLMALERHQFANDMLTDIVLLRDLRESAARWRSTPPELQALILQIVRKIEDQRDRTLELVALWAAREGERR